MYWTLGFYKNILDKCKEIWYNTLCEKWHSRMIDRMSFTVQFAADTTPRLCRESTDANRKIIPLKMWMKIKSAILTPKMMIGVRAMVSG